MASESKKGFVLYYDYRQHLALLKDDERGKLLTALLDYGENGIEPTLDGAAFMAFSFIRAQMDRDAEKYANKVKKRSEAGKQGGRPSKAKEENESNEKQTKAKKAKGFSKKQTKAKKADTVTDTDTDTDTVTDTDTDTDVSPKGDTNIPPDGGIEKPPKGGMSPEAPKAPPSPPAEAPADHVPYKVIVSMYHEICKSYPELRSVSDNRKKAIAARWREHGQNLDTFRELFEKAEASQFLKGKNKRNWAADFNWLMNSDNMGKVLEGNFENGGQEGGQNRGEHSEHPERDERRAEPATAPTLSGFHMAEL